MALDTITALFDSLNDDEQLLLLDHLAERTQVCDELTDGIAAAVLRHYNGICRTTEEAEAMADRLIPCGAISPDTWARHAQRRDALLNGAIRSRQGLYRDADVRPANFTLGAAA